MARDGRELIVSRIEAALMPYGAVVKSADRTTDTINGDGQGLDVAISWLRRPSSLKFRREVSNDGNFRVSAVS